MLDDSGASVPVPQLQAGLQAIVDAADASPAADEEAVGWLTSLPRDEWATLRTQMVEAAELNARSLHLIDSALFAISLDPVRQHRIISRSVPCASTARHQPRLAVG